MVTPFLFLDTFGAVSACTFTQDGANARIIPAVMVIKMCFMKKPFKVTGGLFYRQNVCLSRFKNVKNKFSAVHKKCPYELTGKRRIDYFMAGSVNIE